MIPHKLNPLGVDRLSGEFFTLLVNITEDNLTYSFTPYYNESGYCRVVDWGDRGKDYSSGSSGTLMTHTYATSGIYTIKIKADCTRVVFGVESGSNQNTQLLKTNENWTKLGNLESANQMFRNCINSEFDYEYLPEHIVSAVEMFENCTNALFNKLKMISNGLIDATSMFRSCSNATFDNINDLGGVVIGTNMFDGCTNNRMNPASLSSRLTNADRMFRRNRNILFNKITNLGNNITSAVSMFEACNNLMLNNGYLPQSLTDGSRMFYNCGNVMLFNQNNLPQRLVNAEYMFFNCSKLKMTLNRFYPLLKNLNHAFDRSNLKCNVNELYIYTDTYPEFEDVHYAFYKCQNVTGSQNTFYGKINQILDVCTMFDESGTTIDQVVIRVWSEVYIRYTGYYLLTDSAAQGKNREWISTNGLYTIKYDSVENAWGLYIIGSSESELFKYETDRDDPISGEYWKDGDIEPLIEVLWGVNDTTDYFTLTINVTEDISTYMFKIKYLSVDSGIEFESNTPESGDLLLENGNELYGEGSLVGIIYWGDGSFMVLTGSSGVETVFSHSYSYPGTFTIKMKGEFIMADFSHNINNTNASMILGSNFAWESLGTSIQRVVFKDCINCNFENMNNLPSTLVDAHESFSGCYNAQFSNLEEIPDRVNNANAMFENCSSGTFDKLNDIGNGVLTANSMFYNCVSMDKENFKLNNRLVNANSMFESCTNMKFKEWTDLPNTLVHANSMFRYCVRATFENLVNLGSHLEEADYMFYDCEVALFDKIISIPSTVETAMYMFAECYEGTFDVLSSTGSGLVNGSYMFLNCYKASFKVLGSLGSSLEYSICMFQNTESAIYTDNLGMPDTIKYANYMFNNSGTSRDVICKLYVRKLPNALEDANGMFESFGGACNLNTLNR